MNGRREITKRIVVVDDSTVMRAMFDNILSGQSGFNVVGVARNADEACVLVEAAWPDIVIVDLCMPYIDGSQLLGMLADKTNLCKVVVSSHANLSFAMRRKLTELGAAAIFDKQDIGRDTPAFVAALRIVADRGAVPLAPPSQVIFAANRFPVPEDETDRARTVQALKIANLDPDRRLDILARHLSRLTDYPVASLNVIDTDRLWAKAAVGIAPATFPRAGTICAHAICADGPTVITDALLDPVMSTVPSVAGAPGLRAYIGVPIVARDVRVGMACVADTRPRVATRAEIDVVTDIAALVASTFEVAATERRAA